MPDTLWNLWYALIPLPPLAVALWIGLAVALNPHGGEAVERPTSTMALIGAAISLLAILGADLIALTTGAPGQIRLGTWFTSGALRVDLSLTLDHLGLIMGTLVAVLGLATLWFSVQYMHREPGFRRFFGVLSLFTGAMLLIATAGNAVLTFVGWELAGLSSYLLIGYAQDRSQATEGATRAMVTNRIGDVGLLLAIFLSFHWLGGLEWSDLAQRAKALESLQAGLILFGFLLAALTKSALLPFSAWIGRALEGPTPSSAIFYGALMVHAGVFLLIRCEPLFERAPSLMPLVAIVGLATALYGWLCGLTQADVKSGLLFSTTTQIGLMVLWCGLGWFTLATAHLAVHALWRAYQFLHAPALMYWMDAPSRPVRPWLARRRRLYAAALQRFWLEPIADWLLVRPTKQLAADVRTFDERVVKRLVGRPGEPGVVSSLTDWDETRGPRAADDLAQAHGALGGLMAWLADLLYWFEQRLLLQGEGTGRRGILKDLAAAVTRVEDLLGRPRYLLLLIMATLVVIL